MLARRTLLLADDSPTVQKVVSLTFADEGMRVLTASGGEEALATLGETVPDVLLADVHMPAPGGYELCAHVKRDPRTARVPVLLLVGAFELFDEAEARKAGADGILTKPFQSIRELVNKVGGLISGHPEQTRDAADTREVVTGAPVVAPAAASSAPESFPPPPAEGFQPSPAFAGLDADDENIRSVPADDYVAAVGARASDAAAGFVSFDELFARDSVGDVEEVLTAEAVGSTQSVGSSEPAPVGAAAGSYDERGREATSFGTRQAGSSFAAHRSQPAADDSLLELGELYLPSSRAVADLDDSILDIEEDAAAPPVSPTGGEVFESFYGAVGADAGPASGGEISPANLSSAWSDAPELEVSHAPAAFTAATTEGAAVFERAEPEFEIDQLTAVSGGPAAATVEAASADAPVIGGGAAQPVEVADTRAGAAVSSEGAAQLSPEMVDAIARRVVELMSDRAVREIAWEVVPDLAERLIRERLEEEKSQAM